MGNKRSLWLLASVALNLYLVSNTYYYFGISDFKKQKLSWSEEAAAEAEAVASISCSGHGRAYVDGSTVDGRPVCECHTCYAGPDCSIALPDSNCLADADSGDPLFLEAYWMQHASSSAVVVSGWHRMGYTFSDHSYISEQLESHIRRVHKIARNAVTQGKYILFGGGSTQLLNAAVYALSFNLSAPATVVASIPYYPIYKLQTKFFENNKYEFKGDANCSYANTNIVIEFVTSPNNPDGKLRDVVSQGASAKAIYDHAYYWPHFTAIPAPSNQDIMIFTISKLTGHAGSRFGWAFVKDKDVYDKMKDYILYAEIGISRDTQVRALKLMRAIVEGENYGKEIFDYSYNKMRDRWEKLSKIMSSSKRFSIQEIPPLFCNFFEKVRGPSPGDQFNLSLNYFSTENCTFHYKKKSQSLGIYLGKSLGKRLYQGISRGQMALGKVGLGKSEPRGTELPSGIPRALARGQTLGNFPRGKRALASL